MSDTEILEFWKAVALDHREAFVDAEVSRERFRKALQLIADAPFGVEPHELRAVAAAALDFGGVDAPSLCEAKDCPLPPLTAHKDGADETWWLCDGHGDLLAIGFETRRPRRTAKHSALRFTEGERCPRCYSPHRSGPECSDPWHEKGTSDDPARGDH